LLGLAALPVGWVGLRWAAYGRAAARLPAEMAAARREGLPLTPDELRAALPKVAPADNAAPLYWSLLPQSGGDAKEREDPVIADYMKGYRRGDRPKPTPALRAAIAKLGSRLAVAEEASRKPGCDWGRDWEKGFDLQYPEMALCRSLVRQFCARALLRADDGDLPGAYADIETATRIGRHAGSDPVLIGLLVNVACRTIADAYFDAVLLAHPDDPRAVPLARRADAAFDPAPDFAAGTLGELTLGRLGVAQVGRGGAVPGGGGKGAGEAPSWLRGPLTGSWDAAGIAYWRAVRRAAVENADDPQALARAVAAVSVQEEARLKQPGHELMAILLPAFGKSAGKMVDVQARDRLRRTAIALVEARQRAGRKAWPASLPPAPWSTPDERTDPFTGKPFVYKVTEGGRKFVLYSLGENGRDDGGTFGKGTGEAMTDDLAVRTP
jgi:hypothetical protein